MYQLSFQTKLWVDQLVFRQIAPTQRYPEHYDGSPMDNEDAATPPTAKVAGRDAEFYHQWVSYIICLPW